VGRLYKVQVAGVAVSAAQDILEILAPTDAVVYVHSVVLGQDTDVGDAKEQTPSILVKRGIGAVTSGSGGSTPTAQPVEDGDTAFGGAVEANNTTKMAAGSGTVETLEALNWNIRIPSELLTRPHVISPGNRLTIELESAPTEAFDLNVTALIEEIGG
jgi:hypothetical protein